MYEMEYPGSSQSEPLIRSRFEGLLHQMAGDVDYLFDVAHAEDYDDGALVHLVEIPAHMLSTMRELIERGEL